MSLRRITLSGFIALAAVVGALAVWASTMGQTKVPAQQKDISPTSREALPVRPAASSSPALRKDLTLDLGGGVKLEMVLIPAGEFLMGSPDSEELRYDEEGPQHRVRISKPFYMGKCEVTQGQWQAAMGRTVASQRNEVDPKWPLCGEGAEYPMYYVSWEDCQEFCRNLSGRTGKQVRLPTEAEWEYACRAGTATPFHYGSSLSSDQANFDGNHPYGEASTGVFRKKTMPVGSFQPNAFGLYDMHGNVDEWCQDGYWVYTSAYEVDPARPRSKGGRIRRGGSWLSYGEVCRSAFRVAPLYATRDYTLGFRVVSETQ